MKTSKFVKWQLKQWLPMLVVFFIYAAAILWINAITKNMTGTLYNGYDYVEYLFYQHYDDGLVMMYCVFLLPSFILPYFVYRERFQKTAADAYKAFPTDSRKITRTKLIIAGVFIAALVTIIYWSSIGIYYFRYNSYAEHEVTSFGFYARYKVNFLPYIPAFFVILFFELITFYFNCTLISLGSHRNTSGSYMIFGNLILMLGYYAVLLGIGGIIHNSCTNYESFGGIPGQIQLIEKSFAQMVVEREAYYQFGEAPAIIMYILTAIQTGVGVLAFFIKEPSGEYYGMAGARTTATKSILYVAFGIILAFVAIISPMFGFYVMLLFNILAILFIYISLVVFNKRFTITMSEAVTLLVMLMGYFILTMLHCSFSKIA